MIPYSFWQDVEKNLKHVLYGDSVAAESKIWYKYKNTTGYTSIEKLWGLVSSEITIIDNKEYKYLKSKDLQLLTFDERLDLLTLASPAYIMRHQFRGKIVNIDNKIKVTKNHSLLKFKWGHLTKVSPDEATELLHVHLNFSSEPLLENNIVQNFNNLHEDIIHNKSEEDYDGYVYDLEIKYTHNFVINNILVHNTDSLYLHIPEEYENLDATITGTSIVADEINDRIKYYFNSYMLPKLGVNSNYNNTYFKTELIAESILFLETKKNYAFNLIYKEGKIIDPAETNYTGIPIVKSNTAPLTKDFLEYLIKNIALNKEIITREHVSEKLSIIGKLLNDKIIQCIQDYDFEYISAPCKWNDKEFISEPTTILGMKFYNMITESETFRPGGFGIYFPIVIRNSGALQQLALKHNITLDDVKYMTIPYGYNKELLKHIIIKFDIRIDAQMFWNWDRLGNNKVAKKIIDLIKLSVGLPI